MVSMRKQNERVLLGSSSFLAHLFLRSGLHRDLIDQKLRQVNNFDQNDEQTRKDLLSNLE